MNHRVSFRGPDCNILYNEGFSKVEMRQLIRKVRKIEQKKVSAPTSEQGRLIFMILPLDVPSLR